MLRLVQLTVSLLLCAYIAQAAPAEDIKSTLDAPDVKQTKPTSQDLDQFFQDQPHLNPNAGTLVTLVTSQVGNQNVNKQESGMPSLPSIPGLGSLGNVPTNPSDMMAYLNEWLSYLALIQQFSTMLTLPNFFNLLQGLSSSRTEYLNINITDNTI